MTKGAAFLRGTPVRNLDLIPRAKFGCIGTIGVLRVYLVSGELIRDKIFLNFTEGGNSHAYPWMPPSEIWIDESNVGEAKPILIHELTEFNWMTDGKSYDSGHNLANVNEQHVRDFPDSYGAILEKEGRRLGAGSKVRISL